MPLVLSKSRRVALNAIDHTSDVGFRGWATSYMSQLLNCQDVLFNALLVQTTDTGQINLGTVTRPAVNTAAGYQIFRLKDNSLFFKVEFGTGSSAGIPMMWLTVGTGSNGSGTLTGQTSTRNIVGQQFVPGSPVTIYKQYACVSPFLDSIVLAFGQDAPNGSVGYFQSLWIVSRTVDTSGNPDGKGFSVYRTGSNSNCFFQCVRTATTPVTYPEQQSGFLAPTGLPTTSSRRTDFRLQAYNLFTQAPEGGNAIGVCMVLLPEFPLFSSFSCDLSGASSNFRQYMSLGQVVGSSVNFLGFSANYVPAVIWE